VVDVVAVALLPDQGVHALANAEHREFLARLLLHFPRLVKYFVDLQGCFVPHLVIVSVEYVVVVTRDYDSIHQFESSLEGCIR